MNFKFNGISICVTTWNSAEYLRRLLRSIEDTIFLDHEVIIHDNGSTDGTEKVVGKSFIKDITYIEGPNKGINYGWNRCIEKAKYDWIYTPHSDMVLLTDWVLWLMGGIEKLPCAWKVLGCSRSIEKESHIQCQITGEQFDHDLIKSEEDERLFWNCINDTRRQVQTSQRKHHMVTAPRQPFVYHKMLWDRVGGWDEELFSYAEDDDKILAAWDIGVRYFPMMLHSMVYHFSGRTNKKQNVDKDQNWPYEHLKKKYKETHPALGSNHVDVWKYIYDLIGYYNIVR